MQECPKCGAWLGIFRDEHTCPPQWEIWDDDNWGDEYKIHYALDAESAGEAYARIYDSDGDYTLSNGDTHEVKIRKLGETEWETYELSAVPDVNYCATKIEEE